jgi:hypothetical protein
MSCGRSARAEGETERALYAFNAHLDSSHYPIRPNIPASNRHCVRAPIHHDYQAETDPRIRQESDISAIDI